MRQQQKARIDYKLDYMERLFYKIKFKKTESYVIQLVINRCFLLSHKLIIYLFVILFLGTKKGANQFHSVLKVLDYLYTKDETQLTPMGIC